MTLPRQDLLTAKEVAQRLGISLRTLWRWTTDAILPPPVRLGRVVRWRTSDIDQFIEQLPVRR